jgi:hypothetical protein
MKGGAMGEKGKGGWILGCRGKGRRGLTGGGGEKG